MYFKYDDDFCNFAVMDTEIVWRLHKDRNFIIDPVMTVAPFELNSQNFNGGRNFWPC